MTRIGSEQVQQSLEEAAIVAEQKDVKAQKKRKKKSFSMKSILKNWQLYLLIFPVIAYYAVFHYVPLYGLQIAFKDFIPSLGIWDSPWVGLKHFERFFDSYYFERLIVNTVLIGALTLLFAFPIPIFLALMLNEVQNLRYKKFVQTVLYAPHFLSTVVIVGMLLLFVKPDGVVNQIIMLFGGSPVDFISEPGWFKPLYIISDVWQTMGWSSIIFIAALAAVDPAQHEAASMDGASRLQRIFYINIPAIMPTIIILFILNAGSVMAVGFEKAFLMQNPLNLSSSDVISTFVYRSGILDAQYSFSAAVGLFNSIINFVLLLMVNRIAKRMSETSLW